MKSYFLRFKLPNPNTQKKPTPTFQGRAGVWFFKSYFREIAPTPEYKCFLWYDRQISQGLSWLRIPRPSCPCTLWQAMSDPRFQYSAYFSNTVCYISNFPTFPTSSQASDVEWYCGFGLINLIICFIA